MSLVYLRKLYKVPAFRGREVQYLGTEGRILAAKGPYLSLLLQDGKRVLAHPKDEGLVYPDSQSKIDKMSADERGNLVQRCYDAGTLKLSVNKHFRRSGGKYVQNIGEDLTGVYCRSTGHLIGYLKPVRFKTETLYWSFHHSGLEPNVRNTAKLQRLALRMLLVSWANAASSGRVDEL